VSRTSALPRSRPQDDDAVLLARARAGEAHAREALIGRYLDDVYALTTRMLGNADLGADAAQDAFVNALRGLDGFRGESSFRTWLLRIAANAARSVMRTRGRRRESALELVNERADEAPDPAIRAEQRDEAERALALLAQLPPKQREAVSLRASQGLDYRTIAGILGCSEVAARVNYHHGMRRLRELMQ
jgi:RNA polymerase sigma-70 factor (ECF subfamily)